MITLKKLHKNNPYLDDMKAYYLEYEKADEKQRNKMDFAESHKVNVLNILTDLLNLDTDAEGYNFVVCAYKKQENEDEI